MVSTKFVVVLAVAAAPAVFAYETYLAKIPNGDAMGKKLGHTADGYTPFGTMFSKGGKTWAGVCKQNWPGASVTVGAVLGDPCCKWTSGAADFALSEPFLAGKTCASAATPAPAAATPAPAAATPAPAAATPAPAPAAATPAPGPGKVLPAPVPAPAAGNSTVPAPAPTPAASKPSGKNPHKLCK